MNSANQKKTMLPNSPSVQDRRRSKEPQRIRSGARMLVACIYCKEHKLKCDNGVPACASCVRFSQTCLVEDPITKRHQPRNYLEILETRIAYLEGLLRSNGQVPTPTSIQQPPQQARHNGQFGTPSRPTAPPTPISTATPSAQSDISQADTAQTADDDVDSLSARVGMLGLCAAGMEPRYLGSSSAFAFSRAIGSSFLLRDTSKGTNSGNGEGTNANTNDPGLQSPINVPTYEDGLVLSNAYFENIHIQYPFLHEPTFRMWEVQRVSTLPVPVSDPDVASFFVYIIYAIGALLMPASRYNHEQLYLLAMRYMDTVLQKDNLQSVQALLACCIYSLRSPTGPSLWKLTGFALRQCIELGYHRNVKSFGPQMGAVQVELRKRAFWTAFAIDCSVAMFLGRPLGLSIWEIDVELPKNIGDGNVFAAATSNNSGVAPPAFDLSVALHMFRLRRLWAKIHVALFTDTTRIRTTDEAYTARIQQLQVELDEWRATAPPEPPRTGEALTLFGSNDWYNSNYSHSILLLHRNHLIEARSEVPAPIVIACLEATEVISRGYYRQFILGHVGCPWGCLHVVFLAGLTYLNCLWTSPAARAARPLNRVSSTCMDCSMVFAVMAERWERAAAYRDMFETLSRKTMAMLVEVGVSDNEPAMSAWPGSVVGASTIVAESGSLEDPWEVMQWINEDLLQPTEDAGTFSV